MFARQFDKLTKLTIRYFKKHYLIIHKIIGGIIILGLMFSPPSIKSVFNFFKNLNQNNYSTFHKLTIGFIGCLKFIFDFVMSEINPHIGLTLNSTPAVVSL